MLRSNPDVLRLSAFLFLLLAATAAPTGSQAHSWYPWECCSENDCAPIVLNETPREEKGGFTLIDGRHISYKEVRPSPDGKWHLCETKAERHPRDRRILCVYAPIGGV
jgi:hypothetical protein